MQALTEVSKGTSGTLSRGVTILNTSHLEQLLGNGGRDNSCSAGGRDQTHPDRTALTGNLKRSSLLKISCGLISKRSIVNKMLVIKAREQKLVQIFFLKQFLFCTSSINNYCCSVESRLMDLTAQTNSPHSSVKKS